jgi:electron transfer flavoprotein alpha subunit
MGDILVITEHLKGEFQDITFEMLGKAKELAGASGGQCVAVTFGNMNGKSGELGVADSVISVGGSNDYNPESYAAAVQSVVSAKSPSLVMWVLLPWEWTLLILLPQLWIFLLFLIVQK